MYSIFQKPFVRKALSKHNVKKRMKTMKSTISGFLAYDVFQSLQEALQSSNVEKICYFSTELGCSKEIANIITFLNEYVSQNCLNTNIVWLEALHSHIKVLLNINRKNVATNDLFQKLLCEISLLPLIIPLKTVKFVSDEKRIAFETIEHIFFNYPNISVFIEKSFSGLTNSDELVKYLSALYYSIKEHDKKSVISLIDFLYRWDIELQPIIIEQCTVKENQMNDIIWYIWKALILISKRLFKDNKNYKHLVCVYLDLFSIKYNKKTRVSLINYLFYSALVLTIPKTISINALEQDFIKEACSKIHIVYAEVLEQTKRVTKEVDKYKQEKQEQREIPKKANVKNVVVKNDCSYLHCYTYKNEENQV